MKPKSSPWGGGNQFVDQLAESLKSSGHQVIFRLDPAVTCILLIEPRPFTTRTFSVPDIRAFKSAHPSVRCVHRINECDLRKGTDDVDGMLREANEVADVTVFISRWLRDYFVERWFDPDRAHRVIGNGADPKIFHPRTNDTPTDTFKVVTHHWSSHWNKGFKVYQQVDGMIHARELSGFELMVIGRWPSEIRWRTAVTHGPAKGRKLADLLRQNHVYLTASLWEPCGMHHIEGAQCGLPVIFHEDGGGIVEFGRRYGVGFRDDVKGALIDAGEHYRSLREKVLTLAPSGAQMCREYEEALIR